MGREQEKSLNLHPDSRIIDGPPCNNKESDAENTKHNRKQENP